MAVIEFVNPPETVEVPENMYVIDGLFPDREEVHVHAATPGVAAKLGPYNGRQVVEIRSTASGFVNASAVVAMHPVDARPMFLNTSPG